MSTSEKIVYILQAVGIFATLVLSIFNLVKSNKLARNQHQISVLTQKRSKRIDDLRKTSSNIISDAEIILLDCEKDISQKRNHLIYSVNTFNSLLQYTYAKDIELIDMAIEIKNILVGGGAYNIESIKSLLKDFWKKCDLYIGVEFSRLKIETNGIFQKLGGDEISFNECYDILDNQVQIHEELMKN